MIPGLDFTAARSVPREFVTFELRDIRKFPTWSLCPLWLTFEAGCHTTKSRSAATTVFGVGSQIWTALDKSWQHRTIRSGIRWLRAFLVTSVH